MWLRDDGMGFSEVGEVLAPHPALSRRSAARAGSGLLQPSAAGTERPYLLAWLSQLANESATGILMAGFLWNTKGCRSQMEKCFFSASAITTLNVQATSCRYVTKINFCTL